MAEDRNQSPVSTVLAALQNIVTAITAQTQVIKAGQSAAALASTNLTDTIVPTPFSPLDSSGVGLVFTAVSVRYTKLGNLVHVYGQLTYPVTANGAVAQITLPVAVANQAYANTIGAVLSTAGPAGLILQANQNTSNATFRVTPGGGVLNSALSAAVISFMLVYPVT